MVVAARQTGSAIINPDGSIVALDLGRDKHLVLVGDVRLGPGGAPYTRLGDILGWVMLALFIFSITFPTIVRRRVKKENAPLQA
jgi:apolipoprotein N-acyltransferase